MSKYKIKLGNDNLLASISLIDDGVLPNQNEIMQFLRDNGIVYGIKNDTIIDIASNPKFNIEIPIAYGTGGKIGTAEQIKMLIKQEKINSDQNARIDLRELSSNIVSVESGEYLFEIIPATKGESGKDVLGNEVSGIVAASLKLNLGKNVERVENIIKSRISGELIFRKESDDCYTIDVSQVHEIAADVDYSTGNIRFPGTVIIKGNVKPGFVVEAEGDIEIKGVIESATIIAKGIIKVSGVKGGNKGLVQCRDLHANFIENGIIEVKNDVIVKQAIINSNINAGERVIVEGKAGRIVGGNIVAGLIIKSTIIGSEINTKSHLEVGIPPELNEEMTIINTQIHLDLENLKKISIILKGLAKMKDENKLTPELIDNYRRALENAKQLKSTLEMNERRMEEIKKLIEKADKLGSIIATEILYPGTEVVIHKKHFFPEKAITKVAFLYEEDKIVMHGYSE